MRRFIIVLCGAILSGAAWIAVGKAPPEPTWAGYSLSDWLQSGYGSGMTHVEGDWEEADEAVRGMGTNAIPYLVRELGAKHSPLKWWFVKMTWKQSLVHVPYTPADERRERAIAAFEALGSVATSAVATIRVYLTDPELKRDAVDALNGINGEGRAPDEDVDRLAQAYLKSERTEPNTRSEVTR